MPASLKARHAEDPLGGSPTGEPHRSHKHVQPILWNQTIDSCAKRHHSAHEHEENTYVQHSTPLMRGLINFVAEPSVRVSFKDVAESQSIES